IQGLDGFVGDVAAIRAAGAESLRLRDSLASDDETALGPAAIDQRVGEIGVRPADIVEIPDLDPDAVVLFERGDSFVETPQRRVIGTKRAKRVPFYLTITVRPRELEGLLAQPSGFIPPIEQHQELAVPRKDSGSSRTRWRGHLHRLLVRPKCADRIRGPPALPPEPLLPKSHPDRVGGLIQLGDRGFPERGPTPRLTVERRDLGGPVEDGRVVQPCDRLGIVDAGP